MVGAAAMAEGLVARMKRELGREDATVIATGGLAGIVADSTDAFDVVDGQLTIKASAKSTAACRSWGKTGA